MICSVDDLVVFLRRFHRHWVDSPKLKNVAIPPDLPDGLRIIYRELGALVELDARNHGFRAPFDAQDSLVPLSKLKRIDGMIQFAKENQSVWQCLCPPGSGDPPVYFSVDGEPASKIRDSLNDFLITLCLHEAVFSARVLLAVDGVAFEPAVMSSVKPIWLNTYLSEEPANFYVVPGRDVLLMENQSLWIGAQHESDLGELNLQHRAKRQR